MMSLGNGQCFTEQGVQALQHIFGDAARVHACVCPSLDNQVHGVFDDDHRKIARRLVQDQVLCVLC